MRFKGTPFEYVMDYTMRPPRKVCQFDKDGYAEVPDMYVERMKKRYEVANAEKEPPKEPPAEKKITCKKCGEKFVSQIALMQHYKAVHPKAGDGK